MPVPDLEFETAPVAPGAETTGSLPWAQLCFVRFMRVLMTQNTECRVTFYHDSTFADEDREFRAEKVGNKFLWEGAWAHYDDSGEAMLHYKVENTGNTSSSFRITLKSGTMVANAYSRFVEAMSVDGVEATGTVSMRAGNGVTIAYDEETGEMEFSAEAPETVFLRNWALTPVKPSSYTSSSGTITNVANLSTSTESSAQFGAGSQWIMADIGSVVTLGRVEVKLYGTDGRVYNDVRVEVSQDGTSWTTIKSIGTVWAVNQPLSIEMVSGRLARYVRVWCNGSSESTSNLINKIIPYVLSDEG
jgi:hypothetical protein